MYKSSVHVTMYDLLKGMLQEQLLEAWSTKEANDVPPHVLPLEKAPTALRA